MGFFTYLANPSNEVYINRASVSVTASTTDTGLEAGFVAALPVSKPWKPLGGSDNAWVELDFGGDISADFCAVVNHRVTASGVNVTFNVCAGASPAPTDVMGTLPYASRFTSYVAFASTETHRYWRINMDDPLAGTDGQIGYIVLGMKSAWSFRFPRNWRRSQIVRNRETQSEFGVPMVGTPVVDLREFGIIPQALTAAQQVELQTFLRALNGRQHPALVVPDPETDAEGIFGRVVDGQQDWTRTSKAYSDLAGLVFREDNVGFSLRYSVT